jgi:hypothetical protein
MFPDTLGGGGLLRNAYAPKGLSPGYRLHRILLRIPAPYGFFYQVRLHTDLILEYRIQTEFYIFTWIPQDLCKIRIQTLEGSSIRIQTPKGSSIRIQTP